MKWETTTTEPRIDWSDIKDRLCLGMVATNLLGAAHGKIGDRLFWLCPFHDDKHPSFEVNLTKKLWICRSCGKGGDAASLVMESKKCDFPAAVSFLADLAGVITSHSPGVKPVRPTDHINSSKVTNVVQEPLRDPNRMMNFGTSFDVEMGVARKDRTHGQTLTTRCTLGTDRAVAAATQATAVPIPRS